MKFLLRGTMLVLGSIVTLRDCGNPTTDQAVIVSKGFSPDNPLPGENTTLWIAYDLKTPITGGTAIYSATLNGIPFTPIEYDLCSQTFCPKDVASYNETSNSDFPTGLNGKVVSKIQWKNQNNEPIWCLESTFKINE